MSRWVLGLNLHHDASACLTRDGVPIVALAQERLSRNKHSMYVQNDLIDYCLKAAEIRPQDLDLVVLSSIFLPTFLSDDPNLIWRWYNGMIQRDLKTSFRLAELQPPVTILSHHLAHAYAVCGASGWDEAAVLIVDWAGSYRADLTHPKEQCFQTLEEGAFERERVSLYHFEKGQFRVVDKQFAYAIEDTNPYRLPVAISNGIGGLYEVVGRFLFGKGFMGGKVMGLASYGQSRADLLADVHNDRFCLKWEWLRSLIGQAVPPEDPIKYANMAAAAQRTLEHQVLRLAERLHNETASPRLAYGGGVALNGVLNKRLEYEGPFKEIFILPASNDSGAALGAAYYGNYELGIASFCRYSNDYLGRQYTSEEMLEALRAEAPLIVWRAVDDTLLFDYISQCLAASQVVGWFQGGSEFGPRALGNRSILADARNADMKNVLNKKVKHREEFRPFAPVVLAHRAAEIFELQHDRPFMLHVDSVRPEWRSRIPAATHIDGSARLQTVTKDSNLRLFTLITVFERLTGVPLLINTSLNIAGEPIVERPSEAVTILRRGELDVLVLGNLVAEPAVLQFDDPQTATLIPQWIDGGVIVRYQLAEYGALHVDSQIAVTPIQPRSRIYMEPDEEFMNCIDGKRSVKEIRSGMERERWLRFEFTLREYLRLGLLKLGSANI